jgi:hypothetical protein
MKSIHWFSLAALVLGLALLFLASSTAGGVVLGLAFAVELIYAALTGKQTNDGTH